MKKSMVLFISFLCLNCAGNLVASPFNMAARAAIKRASLVTFSLGVVAFNLYQYVNFGLYRDTFSAAHSACERIALDTSDPVSSSKVYSTCMKSFSL